MRGRQPGQKPGNAGKTYPAEGLTRAEVVRILEANDRMRGWTAVRNHAIIMTLYRAGLRISECLDLRPKDVDFENHCINVMHGKGDKRRTVGVDDSALEAIDAWLNVRQAGPTDPLFCTRGGGRVQATYIRSLLHRLGEEASIPKRVHPHGFRHTFAAELAREGVPAHIIQRQLGHSNLATTTRYLAVISPTETIEWIRKREHM